MKKFWQRVERMSDSEGREACLICIAFMEAVLLTTGEHGIGALLVPGMYGFTYAVLRFGFGPNASVAADR
ncbi:MAG: hypothetical protein AAB695_00160 [Patescibacteria group bacterium]